jgi:hypothetical protein
MYRAIGSITASQKTKINIKNPILQVWWFILVILALEGRHRRSPNLRLGRTKVPGQPEPYSETLPQNTKNTPSLISTNQHLPKDNICQMLVAHACNPSYSGGRE